MHKKLTVAIITMVSIVAQAQLFVAAQGSMDAGPTNLSFVATQVPLSRPIRIDTVEVFNTGTNDAIVALFNMHPWFQTPIFTNEAIAGNASYIYAPTGTTSRLSYIPPTTLLRFEATKSAGTTNGAPSRISWRIFGSTQ